MVSPWSIELEPEVAEWLMSLKPNEFAYVEIRIDNLAKRGSSLRMPHSRSLGGGLFELRFDLDKVAQRITFYFTLDRRIILLTVFRKQRSNERFEVERARRAMQARGDQGHIV